MLNKNGAIKAPFSYNSTIYIHNLLYYNGCRWRIETRSQSIK